MLDKRVKKRIQEAGGVFKDRDIREITEAAVPIENQSGGGAGDQRDEWAAVRTDIIVLSGYPMRYTKIDI